jgi:hypothetical protein
MKNETLLKDLLSPWPADYHLQPDTAQERFNVIAIQSLKKQAAEEINRLVALIDDHNADCICDKERCGYAGYNRNCPNCPIYDRIDY